MGIRLPQDHPQSSSHVGAVSYKPLFFSPQPYQMVDNLAEMIIPEEDDSSVMATCRSFWVSLRLPTTLPIEDVHKRA